MLSPRSYYFSLGLITLLIISAFIMGNLLAAGVLLVALFGFRRYYYAHVR